MRQVGRAGGSAIRRALVGLLVAVAIGIGVGGGALLATAGGPATGLAGRSSLPGPSANSSDVGPATAPPTAEPTSRPSPTPTPAPTPEPTPILVAAPLTGLLVDPAGARRHPIAVMIDDHRDARPQSGFNAASIVWHAPAEGGIPRYMLIFQDQVPGLVGPVRSSRQYYIEWASEWNAVYVHSGGSPQALATLREKGHGQLVWNADEFRYGGRYLWRATDRRAPHNVYTNGEHLAQLAAVVGAKDGPIEPAWTFASRVSDDPRPAGTMLTVHYPDETITYRYDAASNTYPRFIDKASKPQVDAADGKVVAPSNVVILRMRFGALNDGHPDKKRLDADDVGTGEAIISTNGRTIVGTWSKASASAPTLLFDAAGKPARLTAGQTFVQVLALSYRYEIKAGIVARDGVRFR
ncbi:MAG: DUF3048 domain-containing protein [Candidatus Limnocylindrales bacterium]